MALSWLAEACPTLLTVSIKGTNEKKGTGKNINLSLTFPFHSYKPGTKISNGAMEAVKHAWPFSSIHKYEQARGFFPADNAWERIFIQEQAKSWHAVVKIQVRWVVRGMFCPGGAHPIRPTPITHPPQSLLRKVREKRNVAALKRDRKQEHAAMKIQAFFLRAHTLAVQNRRQAEAQRAWHAALAVQRLFRRWRASRQVAARRRDHVRSVQEARATQIQKAWRDAQACKDVRYELQQRTFIVCHIQKLVRGRFTRLF